MSLKLEQKVAAQQPVDQPTDADCDTHILNITDKEFELILKTVHWEFVNTYDNGIVHRYGDSGYESDGDYLYYNPEDC
jgi:hypothetical protein